VRVCRESTSISRAITIACEPWRLGFAASSAPFVATLVDVTGLLIYFSIATVMLRGTLL